jgi:hypothetical protein
MTAARKTSRRKRKPAAPPKSGTPMTPLAGDRSQRLGGRHTCYACGAKFYDLNRPEPVCPRCHANQRLRPKGDTPRPAPPEKPKPVPPPPRDMSALLDDEEEVIEPVEGSFGEEDVDLDLGELEEEDPTLFEEEEEEAPAEEEE